MVAVTALPTAIFDKTLGGGLWDRFEPVVAAISDFWPLSILFVFAAYLIGAVMRAVPVNSADGACRRLFRRTIPTKNDRRKMYEEAFPYRSLLKYYITSFKKYNLVPNNFILDENDIGQISNLKLHNLFIHFKNCLCSKSPDIYSTVKEFESRVRLFSGMFIAGICGLILVSCLLVIVLLNESVAIWWPFVLTTAFTSLLLILAFGRQLPKARKQEAMHVYLAYFAQ